MADPKTSSDRRNFLKKAALGGIALGGLIHLSVEDTIAQTTQKVSRMSNPSDLKITDLRVAEKATEWFCQPYYQDRNKPGYLWSG